MGKMSGTDGNNHLWKKAVPTPSVRTSGLSKAHAERGNGKKQCESRSSEGSRLLWEPEKPKHRSWGSWLVLVPHTTSEMFLWQLQVPTPH